MPPQGLMPKLVAACQVYIGNVKVADKGGHSKKEAKQSAVSAALKLLMPNLLADFKVVED